MIYLVLRNWDQFQHYKDRNPPWIKLYNSLLDDYHFAALPDETKWHVVASTLLASRTNNKIPADPKWIAAKVGATKPVSIDLLLASGMFEQIQDDGCAITVVRQDASKMLDQSRERAETEREQRQSKLRASRLTNEWELPVEWGVWAADEGLEIERIRLESEKFRDYWTGVPGAKGLKTNWQGTWRNWIRKAKQDGNGRSGRVAADRRTVDEQATAILNAKYGWS